MPKRLITVLIVALFAIGILLISMNPPSAKRRQAPPNAAVAVDVLAIESASYEVKVDSYGRVRPRTQSQILPQVAAQVLWVSDNFRSGGFFEKGETLLRLDDSDYKLSLINAKANLANAKQLLSEEQARVSQAKADWKRARKKGPAPDIVLRIPQLEAAKANLASAEASLQQAEINLQRTNITAPYAGRILNKSADVGQLVGSGTVLATIYSTDSIEVRLPVKSRDLAYVNLPEKYRHIENEAEFPNVEFESRLMGFETWSGQVIETEAAIDEASRQLYVVAQIKDPYGAAALQTGEKPKLPLKIGQYVNAKISGKTLQDAIVIPNRVIYQGSYVYLEQQGKLQRRDITIAWQNAEEAIISSGLKVGDRLITTNLGQLLSGTAVRVIGDKPKSPPKRKAMMLGGAKNTDGQSKRQARHPKATQTQGKAPKAAQPSSENSRAAQRSNAAAKMESDS